MSREDLREVHRALREAQTRYAYFLLAAAAAAIGVAANQTQTAALASAHIPLGVAVAMWGASFYFGCRHLVDVGSALYANVQLLRLEAGLLGGNQYEIAAASQEIRGAPNARSESSNRNAKRQFRWLVAGAVSFILWDVGQMYLRAIPLVEVP